MSEPEKSSVWDLTVKTESRYRTVFSEEITAEEAVKLFNQGEFVDVMDIETYEEEAITASW